ncbi:hypothetical protein MKW94_018082 [Papaver nudicaule]|uniref:WAT1-related protein n=1 Tax=Papaver nudicaule TaxID=74823 RepID=A0AA41S1B6_PAPNU|nr:hypothetical protein [Papaver nudicaule]
MAMEEMRMTLSNRIIQDVIPGLAMVLMEGITVGLTIMTKTVMARGMSPFVFIAYTNVASSILLLPSFFFFHRPRESFFNLSLLSKFFFLGLIGVTLAQNFAFMGLNYSSPIVVATMANQLPGFSFLFSIVLRFGQVEFNRPSTRAKSIGTMVSMAGAVFVAVYKGPALWKPALTISSSLPPWPLFIFGSTPESWILGCILLAGATLCASVWNIIQITTVQEFPDARTIVTLYSLFGTAQCVIISVIAERNLSAWVITDAMEISNILLSALFGSIIRSYVQGWCVRREGGPLFIAMFKPFTVFIAVSLGFLFFGHTFHFGSVIGSFIAAMGYYCSMWGQIIEGEENQIGQQHVPLLHDETSCSP